MLGLLVFPPRPFLSSLYLFQPMAFLKERRNKREERGRGGKRPTAGFLSRKTSHEGVASGPPFIFSPIGQFGFSLSFW